MILRTIFEYHYGFFDVLKKSRKQVNHENQEQGKAGERRIRDEYEFAGYEVKRTGAGHDLKAEKKIGLQVKKIQNTLKSKQEIQNYLNFKRKNVVNLVTNM